MYVLSLHASSRYLTQSGDSYSTTKDVGNMGTQSTNCHYTHYMGIYESDRQFHRDGALHEVHWV